MHFVENIFPYSSALTTTSSLSPTSIPTCIQLSGPTLSNHIQIIPTLDYGLHLSHARDLSHTTFCDSDWIGDTHDHKFISCLSYLYGAQCHLLVL